MENKNSTRAERRRALRKSYRRIKSQVGLNIKSVNTPSREQRRHMLRMMARKNNAGNYIGITEKAYNSFEEITTNEMISTRNRKLDFKRSKKIQQGKLWVKEGK